MDDHTRTPESRTSTTARGQRALAVGRHAVADGDHSIALGEGAQATRPYEISIWPAGAAHPISVDLGEGEIYQRFRERVFDAYKNDYGPVVASVTEQGSRPPDRLSLLHSLWGKAHGTPDYDKSQWLELQAVLSGLISVESSFAKRVREEAHRAQVMHGATYHSDHEAFAVLLEEVEEIKAWVWKKRAERDRAAMVKELVQIAAVCTKWATQLEGLS